MGISFAIEQTCNCDFKYENGDSVFEIDNPLLFINHCVLLRLSTNT